MKRLFFFMIILLNLNVFSQDFTIVQINAKWNIQNNWIVPQMDGINYQFAYLEDQKNDIKSKINAVPVVIMYKGNKPIHQWNADLSFKLELDQNEICSIINKHQ
ncbi:MAG: hypothetical protein CMP95_06550 [Gammaproteobacteria bacterium]|nr:hypothetical protein [Gammaproteobacteria bacterium]